MALTMTGGFLNLYETYWGGFYTRTGMATAVLRNHQDLCSSYLRTSSKLYNLRTAPFEVHIQTQMTKHS